MKTVASLSLLVTCLAAPTALAQTPPAAEPAPSTESPAPAPAAEPTPSAEPLATPPAEAPSARVAGEATKPAGTIEASAGVAPPSAAPTPAEPEARRSLGEQNSLRASSGLLRLSEAGSGAAGTFRFSLLGSIYSGTGFLCKGTPGGGCGDPPRKDHARRFGATLGLSVTPWSFLEGFLGVRAKASSSNLKPKLLQSIGDLNVGLKAFAPVAKVLRFGGQAEVWFLSDAGDVGIAGAATSYSLRGLGTLDLTEGGLGGTPLPLKAHLNLGWYFDNSSALVTHNERITGRPITRIERFGLGVNRLDSLNVALGVEGVWSFVRPFVEWSIDVPEARQRYMCLKDVVAAVNPGDGCLKSGRSFSSTPSRLGLGTRVFPFSSQQWLDGVSATVALEIGTGATSKFLAEVVPEVPWNLYLGLGYALDAVPRKPVVIERVKVERVAAQPVHHYVAGRVLDAASGEPVPRALVEYEGRDLTGMVADQKGTFKTLDLEPGAYRFKVTADGYREGQCQTTLPEQASEAESAKATVGADGSITVSLDCKLEALPKVGTVTGTVFDATSGAAIPNARVKIKDKLDRELNLAAGASGSFRFEDVPAGKVRLLLEAPDYLPSVTEVEVHPREDLAVRLNLNRRPAKAGVAVGAKELKLSRPILFQTDSSTILPESKAIVQELADVLRKHAELRLVEVQGHTDDVGPAIDNRKLSQRRAEAVRDELIALGVDPARLTANGYGPDKPLVPNNSDANRAKNRRVQLVVQEKGP